MIVFLFFRSFSSLMSFSSLFIPYMLAWFAEDVSSQVGDVAIGDVAIGDVAVGSIRLVFGFMTPNHSMEASREFCDSGIARWEEGDVLAAYVGQQTLVRSLVAQPPSCSESRNAELNAGVS